MILPAHKQTFIDPVCGMSVDPETAAAKTRYQGVAIYFCDEACKNRFEADPDKFSVKKRKGFWQRYLDRLQKSTGGKPPACH